MSKSETTKKPSCGQCKFFDTEKGDTEIGYCLRYPPQVYVENDSDVDFAVPPMRSDEWCGEFSPKDIPNDIANTDTDNGIEQYDLKSLKDYQASLGAGVRINATGEKLWVCVDGICVLRVLAPEIELTDDRIDY